MAQSLQGLIPLRVTLYVRAVGQVCHLNLGV